MSEEVNQVITSICEEQCMLNYKVTLSTEAGNGNSAGSNENLPLLMSVCNIISLPFIIVFLVAFCFLLIDTLQLSSGLVVISARTGVILAPEFC